MKKIFIWFIIIFTILIFLYAFSSSYNSQNIDHLDYVIALCVDTIPNSSDLMVSFEFANLKSFSENSSSENSEPIIDSIIAPSISNAINLLNGYVGKQINLSHCKVIVFSKDFSKRGIFNELSTLTHNIQIRPTTNIIISEGEAIEYVKKSISSLEQVLTKYYDLFPTSSEYTGFTSNIPLGMFYDNILNKNCGAVTILGKEINNTEKKQTNSQDNQTIDPQKTIVKGDHGTENMGLAIFKDDKYLADLTPKETLCYSLIKDEVDNFLITLKNPFDNSENIDIYINSLSHIDIDLDISNINPIITIKLNLQADVLNILGKSNLPYSETLKTLNESVKKYLSSEFEEYLYKTSKEYKTDINEFYKIAKHKFLTNSDFDNYNWEEKYENCEFNIKYNENIVSNLIIKDI